MLYVSIPDINSFLQHQDKSQTASKSCCFPSSPLAVCFSHGPCYFQFQIWDRWCTQCRCAHAQLSDHVPKWNFCIWFGEGNACIETLTWLEIFHTALYTSEELLMAFFLLSEVRRSYLLLFLSLCPDSPEHQANGSSPIVQALQWIQTPSTQDTA